MAEDPDLALQLQLLRTPLAEPGSGLVRYAAAMHFFRRKMMDADTLEIFRALAKDDGADALSIAHAKGCVLHPAIIATVQGGATP